MSHRKSMFQCNKSPILPTLIHRFLKRVARFMRLLTKKLNFFKIRQILKRRLNAWMRSSKVKSSRTWLKRTQFQNLQRTWQGRSSRLKKSNWNLALKSWLRLKKWTAVWGKGSTMKHSQMKSIARMLSSGIASGKTSRMKSWRTRTTRSKSGL